MPPSLMPTDPDHICEADKAKLLAIYTRLYPDDIVTGDDPRRDSIAAEILDVGLAPTPADALEVIAWWGSATDDHEPVVASIRKSFARLKLLGTYAPAPSGH